VLPKQDIVTHEIELNPDDYPKQAEILKTLAEHAAIQIEEGIATNMMSILSLITRQRQAATWPGGIVLHEPKVDPESDIGDYIRDEEGEVVKFDIPVGLNFAESVKIDRAVELTREFVDDEQRIVIFSQFRETLSELNRRFDAMGISAAEFHGGTTTADRERIKANFDRAELSRTGAQPVWDVVLCHYKTGGVGLNLTAATATIIMDEEWNPGKNQQAYDRTHRMGQTEQTSVHILRLANSIDAWMADLNDKKTQLIRGFDSANEDAKKEMANVFRRVANA
jgi:SNF2 family DNA or RNA helicase